MKWLNRQAHRVTRGRMDALGVLMFLVSIAWFIGLMLQLAFGQPIT